MAVKFKGPTKHGVHTFLPGGAVAFKDKHAEDYFVKAGFAEKAGAKDEVAFTYPEGTVEIDPDTVHADGARKGLKVLEG